MFHILYVLKFHYLVFSWFNTYLVDEMTLKTLKQSHVKVTVQKTIQILTLELSFTTKNLIRHT